MTFQTKSRQHSSLDRNTIQIIYKIKITTKVGRLNNSIEKCNMCMYKWKSMHSHMPSYIYSRYTSTLPKTSTWKLIVGSLSFWGLFAYFQVLYSRFRECFLDHTTHQSSHLAKAQNATTRDIGQGISLSRRSGPILPDGLAFFFQKNPQVFGENKAYMCFF